MSLKKEAQARIKINKLLEEADWRFFDNSQGKANIICESRTTRKKLKTDELGNDFEKTENGFVDYLLLNDFQKPIALVEAKRENINPLDAKQPAREYARSLQIRYVFLSNGNVHFFWDLEQGNPVRISKFLKINEITQAGKWNPDIQKLTSILVDENYVASSQDPKWLSYSPQEKKETQQNQDIRLLRDYQIDAVKALQNACKQGKNRFLFEMATGTGKTLTSAAIAKLFLRSENAYRILFLVDRIELERQAEKDFQNYLGKEN